MNTITLLISKAFDKHAAIQNRKYKNTIQKKIKKSIRNSNILIIHILQNHKY